MKSKVEIAREAAGNGINTYIADAKRESVILEIASGKVSGICTFFNKVNKNGDN